jgi:3D (Asp-Asp-Asp) domain-containing protein
MRHAALVLLLSSVLSAVTAAAPPRQRHPRSSPSRFTATAYCRKGQTDSGVRSQTGVVAADPRVLPIGSVVRILDGPAPGTYTVLDTGGRVKGRKLDIFVANCASARRFGRRQVGVRVVQRGPNPQTARAVPDRR